ncbi:hypothetical protein LTR85_011710 [Meristemomyces frigidus]|nr:hypothetical protein LTR85_011710 [Meristemomyces frigidus]
MAAYGPNATLDDVEGELDFMNVLIESLDEGSDDYASKLAEYQNTRYELELRLEALQPDSRPPTQAGMDGASDQGDAFWQTTMNGRPLSSNGTDRVVSGSSAASHNGTKRTFPFNMSLDTDLHASKRPTPDPSNAGTPTSSLDSFEFVERPQVAPGSNAEDAARRRQLAAEAAIKRQMEAERADNLYAQSLSQQHNRPSSTFASSSRSGIQTTLGHNGSFQRPPPPQVKADPYATPSSQIAGPSQLPFAQYSTQQSRSYKSEAQMPRVKPEPGSSLPQRSRQSTAVVDLTASDDEDDAIAEIAPNSFTPSRRAPRPAADAYGSQARQPMPGAYPMPNNNVIQPVYDPRNAADERVRQQYGLMRGAQLATLNAIAGVKYAASSVSGQLGELSGLINGSNAGPYTVDDDDDLVYGGARQRPLGGDPLDPYAGQAELYRNRFDALAAYDPGRTKEEISTLLENIRPDEEMPAHLRVQTPDSMTIKLHKYQELGLTWLKKCEEGSNKGGILADDMGLGKTIQMLSLMVTRRSDDPRCKTTLVVAPVALMRQWKQEIQTKIKPGFHHALSVYIHHGASKKKTFRELQTYDVVLTTYGSIASEVKKMEKFRLRQHNDPDARPYPQEQCALMGPGANWYRIILDEAQCIKNRSTQTAKGAYLLNAKYRFCMTGTPMMNNVDELFSLIHFLRIRPYSSWEKFRIDFSAPQRSGSEELKAKSMRMLQALCKAVMLRRTKKSTFEGKPILVLPERTTEIDNPDFSPDELSFYQSLEQRTALQFNKYLKAGTVGKSYSAILVLLLRLRQACCHPHLIRDFGVSATAEGTAEDLVKLAEELAPQVIARIKEKQGSFECAVCYDVATNPSIFIPCGHDTCAECCTRITDASDNGDGNGAPAKCPNCRGPVDKKRVTDFDSFKRAHQRDLLTVEELAGLEPLVPDAEGDDSETDSDEDSDTDSETESDDDVDHKGNLRGFIVNDDDDSDSETDSGAGDGQAGPSTANGNAPTSRKTSGKSKKKSKGGKKSKKAKGKGKEKKVEKNKALSLADLKKLSRSSTKFRKMYLRRLHKDWVTSAKIEKALEILKAVMDDTKDSEKVLIFSQWTSLLDLLEVPIDKEGWGYRRYDGSMNANQRADAVDDFRNERKNVRIMLVSLKAGNAGLNLNIASQVIILDPFWNPYIEEQAIDRAHRIGQTRPVKVHRVLIEGTVEDRIITLQEKKRATISQALDEKAHQSISRLGVQELAYLFGVTANPTQAVQYVPQRQR